MKRSTLFLIFTFALLSLQGTKDENATVFNLKTFEKSLKYIPAGSLISEDEPGYLTAKASSFKSFYMYEHEVSNRDYLTFLNEIKLKDETFYKTMLPDTTVWQSKFLYNGPYTELYLRHPSYRDYPVVGVSHEQAQHYCKWLTARYAKEEKRKFNTAEFRLPTSDEWQYAAKGGLSGSPFPWGGPYMQNKNGQWLANFHVVPQNNIVKKTIDVKKDDGTTVSRDALIAGNDNGIEVAGFVEDNADITAPVISYFTNDYGLYNMAGNVEEFVAEPGITHGGSFNDTGYYLQNHVTEQYDITQPASFERGFRFMMVVE